MSENENSVPVPSETTAPAPTDPTAESGPTSAPAGASAGAAPAAVDQTAASVGAADDRRRSPFLAVLGVLALLVAGWGFADGPSLGDTRALPWALLAVGLVVGFGLIVSGVTRRR